MNIETTTPDNYEYLQMQLKQGGGISIELGDIIRIEAPTNDEFNDQTFYVIYIDTDIPDNISITIVNIANFDKKELRILEGKYLSDESITNISLLARNAASGYARQHNLLPDTWIDIRFGGDFPTVLTGQITNLEDDMIEITTYPAISVIYIDFGYRGIPPELPIEEIVIREKPSSISSEHISNLNEVEDGEISEEASIQYTDNGESIITIPTNAKPNENIEDVLQQMYLDGDDIFGEELGDVILEVEVPENQKRYGIETQTESLMDSLLADIPIHKRTKPVLDNIHRLIDRFKELRQMYSVFDNTGTIKDIKILGKHHNPLHNKLLKLEVQVPWLMPIVSNLKRLYSESKVHTESDDILNYTIQDLLQELENCFERMQSLHYHKTSSSYEEISDSILF
jgi:hypothetical protein